MIQDVEQINTEANVMIDKNTDLVVVFRVQSS